MSGGYTVFGDFTGKFYTLQDLSLDGSFAFPVDGKHQIRIIEGSLIDARFEEDFRPEQYRKLSSFLLKGVPKIEIKPKQEGVPFPGTRVYNFISLLLIDPVVTSFHEVNGKTYGEVRAKAYGLSEKNPLISKLNSEEVYPLPEDPDTSKGDIETPDDDVSTGEKVKEIFENVRDKSSEVFSGCLSRFWEIIGFLFLLFLLIQLFRTCNNAEDQCELKEQAKAGRDFEKYKLDSVRKLYDTNLTRALAGISTIYFYRNSNEIHENSSGNNSPVQRLYNLISAYDDKKFIIEGYHSGKQMENAPRIDELRAIRLRDVLVSMGISSSRLIVVAKGDSPMIDPPDKLDKYLVTISTEKEYNRNMRAEVKEAKNE